MIEAGACNRDPASLLLYATIVIAVSGLRLFFEKGAGCSGYLAPGASPSSSVNDEASPPPPTYINDSRRRFRTVFVKYF